jgi:hypothetical protein
MSASTPGGYAEASNKVFALGPELGEVSLSSGNKLPSNKSTNMKSTAPRDPRKDIMLSPGNAALILIDYQPPQISTVDSMDRQTLINNVVALCKTAKLYELPIILSAVNVSNGVNEDTIPEIREVLGKVTAIKTKPIEGEGKQVVMVADFTMRGVTKELRLPVTLSKPIKDPWGKIRVGLGAKTKLNRRDYGINYHQLLETGVAAVGEEVELDINTEAVKETGKSPAAK